MFLCAVPGCSSSNWNNQENHSFHRCVEVQKKTVFLCSEPGCNSSDWNNQENHSFHRFPKDDSVKQKWLRMLDRGDWKPKVSSRVCGKHFHEKCFIQRNSKGVKLLPGSVPTLFMPIALKPKRKVSSYMYRDISPVPGTSAAASVPDLNNTPRIIEMEKTIERLKKRLDTKQKKLKNLQTQKKRSREKVTNLKQVIKNFRKNPSLQNNTNAAVMGSCSNNLFCVSSGCRLPTV